MFATNKPVLLPSPSCSMPHPSRIAGAIAIVLSYFLFVRASCLNLSRCSSGGLLWVSIVTPGLLTWLDLRSYSLR
ncbi:hypothetical protein BJV78DRAFT_539415 [Lactifluus subvellereus]|nr:hypothetical protein BJV78DRAFT_539415 [Lactifluus subvellereus]